MSEPNETAKPSGASGGYAIGDTVRVRDPSQFISSFAKRIANRDAVVVCVWPHSNLAFRGKVRVRFLKRNGRGNEFEEILRADDIWLWPNRDA